MDAGKLSTRVVLKDVTKVSDGFGGTTASLTTIGTVWASVREVKGDIEGEGYSRGRYLNIEVVMREKTVNDNSINENTVLTIQSKTGDYKIKSIFEDNKNKFVKIVAVKTD
tara:strand:+ start:1147 stop:1479 length:333 start_codon:yes stop_codon:yes gene_type:complete